MARKPKCSRASIGSQMTSITVTNQMDAQMRAYLMNFKLNKKINAKSESLIKISVTRRELEIIGKRFTRKEPSINSLNSCGEK